MDEKLEEIKKMIADKPTIYEIIFVIGLYDIIKTVVTG